MSGFSAGMLTEWYRKLLVISQTFTLAIIKTVCTRFRDNF
jgi:hypothetical protein